MRPLRFPAVTAAFEKPIIILCHTASVGPKHRAEIQLVFIFLVMSFKSLFKNCHQRTPYIYTEL